MSDTIKPGSYVIRGGGTQLARRWPWRAARVAHRGERSSPGNQQER